MRTKKKAGRKRVMALLCASLITANLPIGPSAVYAADAADTPGRTAYADKKGLQENYDLRADTPETEKSVQRVIFGKDGNGKSQKWKIAGKDKEIDGDNIVLFADSAIKTPGGEDDGTIKFWTDSSPTTKDYPADDAERKALGITYAKNNFNPAKVNVNHYGTSTLRSELREMAKSTNYFTAAQQALMNPTTITTEDTYIDPNTGKNGNYTTTDILYAAYGDYYDNMHITVGTNKEENGSLNNGLKIDINNWGDKDFWLRAPDPHHGGSALDAWPGGVCGRYHCELSLCGRARF